MEFIWLREDHVMHKHVVLYVMYILILNNHNTIHNIYLLLSVSNWLHLNVQMTDAYNIGE